MENIFGTDIDILKEKIYMKPIPVVSDYTKVSKELLHMKQ